MAAPDLMANGDVTPPQQIEARATSTASSGTKRKRDETEGDDVAKISTTKAHQNGLSSSSPGDKAVRKSSARDAGESHAQVLESMRDILAALRIYDIKPSILDATLPTEGGYSTADEPSAKRSKLAPTTIAARVENAFYTEFDALIIDVDAAIDQLLNPLHTKEISLPQTQYGRSSALTSQETQLWNDTIAFKKLAVNIVQAEKQRHKLVQTGKRSLAESGADGEAKEIEIKKEVVDTLPLSQGKSVLTLFANAPGPRQLFSSFQQANHNGQKTGALPALRENGLPAFISTTTIPSVELDDSKKKSKRPTLGELFPPPAHLNRLQPPKQTKNRLVTTSNNVEFVQIDAPVRTNRKNSYSWFSDKQSVGHWIGYGGLDAQQEPFSPQAKRKQRDRALSTGEAFLPPTEGEKIALKHARNDALFKRAYGSFAPTRDDAVAVVPTIVKNDIWMNKLEERLAQKTVFVDPVLLGEEEIDPVEREKEIESFQEVVDNFDPALLEWDGEKDKEAKELNDILQEINDLLETLSSYQRIRNSSLSTSSRTAVGQSTTATDMMGTPSTPSSAELEVYKTLKLQLAVMIGQLPPYAVARLNGDKLQELNIKQSITLETENSRGIMAEDEATRQARIQAYTAAAGTQQPATRTPASNQYTNYSSTSNPYSRTPATQQQIRPSGPQGHYTPGPQGTQRPAPAPFSRSTSGVQTYSAGYPSTTGQRVSTPQQPPNFMRTGSGSNNYQPNSTSQFYQQIQQAATKPAFNPASPSTQRHPYAQNSSAASTYQRPANAATAQMYSGYAQAQSPHRTASPLATAASTTSAVQAPATGSAAYNRPPPTPTATSYSSQSAAASAATPNSNFYRPGSQPHHPGQQSGYSAPAARPSAPALTPSRQSSGTPQPVTAHTGAYPPTQQVNGTIAQMIGGQSS